jgi:superfamily II DNA or RNA helicase
MRKQADILTKLQPHQQKAVERALKNNLILAHSTGSGKTLTSIAIADKLGLPTTVLTPAPLVENFNKELLKHKKGGPKVNVVSLPTAVARGYDIPKGNTLIIDEAHSLRNAGTQRQKYIQEQAKRAARILLLTGTPAYNNLTDWAPLVNIAAGEDIVPSTPSAFEDRYVQEHKIDPGVIARWQGVKAGVVKKLKNKAELKKRLSKYVDVFDADIEKPKRIDETIKVELSPEQLRMYKAIQGKVPYAIIYKMRNNLPPSKAEASQLNAFLTGVRQVSNSMSEYDTTIKGEDLERTSPKLRKAVEYLAEQYKKNKDFRGFVYSNYIGSGVNPVSEMLKNRGVPHNLFTGAIGHKDRKRIVEEYNSGRVPVIIGSGSASEGLDLKGTSVIQLLEPHFNQARLDQVIGRGIRYKSHEHLSPEKRKVLVQRYLATLPDDRGILGKLLGEKRPSSVDEYLNRLSEDKQELIDEAKSVFK